MTIYIPGTININRDIDNAKHVNAVATMFADMFGGATSQDVTGYWVSSDHGIVTEKITQVYSFSKTEDINKHLPKILAYCERLKVELQQEAISLELNGKLYFI